MIYEPMVCPAQNVHISCIKISTISKRTKSSFHLSLVTRSTIECIQNEFQAYGTFDTNCASILRQGLHYLQTDWIELWLEPHHIRVSLGVSKTISSLWYIRHKSNTYLTLTLTLSPNGPDWDSTWPKSPTSSSGCVQNDLWACGTFGAKQAPILRQD
jgi:hypothetical protein